MKITFVALWCSGYHYCTTSFNKAWTQVLHRFKSCLRHVRDSRWWGSLTMVRLEIRLNAFCRSTRPQKQVIIIIITLIIIVKETIIINVVSRWKVFTCIRLTYYNYHISYSRTYSNNTMIKGNCKDCIAKKSSFKLVHQKIQFKNYITWNEYRELEQPKTNYH